MIDKTARQLAEMAFLAMHAEYYRTKAECLLEEVTEKIDAGSAPPAELYRDLRLAIDYAKRANECRKNLEPYESDPRLREFEHAPEFMHLLEEAGVHIHLSDQGQILHG